MSGNTDRLENLNKKAIDFFQKSNMEKVAVAVSGSEESLVLLNAAVYVFGNSKVFAVTADTGHINDKRMRVIEAACDLVHIEYSVVPVQLYDVDMGAEDITETTDYKSQIFVQLLHEAWMFGFDTLAYACTHDNYETCGNSVISGFDGVVCPFYELN